MENGRLPAYHPGGAFFLKADVISPRLRQLTTIAVLAAALTACGGGGGGSSMRAPPPRTPAPAPAPEPSVVTTSPLRPAAPYAGVLRACTYAGETTEACTLDTLPFVGMENTDPGIDEVLQRTLVSHEWMGVNLQRILGELPADVLPLFRSVTAVVIASDVRPAHYDPNTGAIYLDPDFLWLTVAERNTVSTAPDPRSNFGIELQFAMPWRFVRANEPLTIYLNADGSRDLEQIVDIMAYLLYHELAHATDFMPPGRQAALPGHLTVLQALNQQPPLSSQFVAVYPLQSATLRDLAAVSFLGETATPAQRALQPVDLVDGFANDGALQYYAYTTQFEDFATLFDAAMMSWHFGYDKDTAITDRSASGDTADAIVAWGERGRLGAQQVNARALDVGQRMYPGDLSAFEGFLLGLPAPTPMRAGETWQQNLDLQTPPASTQQHGETGIDRRKADYFLERVRIR